MYTSAQAVPAGSHSSDNQEQLAAAGCQSRLEVIQQSAHFPRHLRPQGQRMSGSGEQGTRPVPGPTGEPSAEAEVVALPRKRPTWFVCEVCGKGFLHEPSQKLHQRAHGERPFTVPGAMGSGSSSHVTSSVHRQERDSFVEHGPLSDPVVPQSMGAETAAISALRHLALLPSPQVGDRGGSAYGVPSGFCMSIEDMKQIWKVGNTADGGSNRDGERGCVAGGACTRPELPPRDSLSRPVILAAARAHAVAYQHACESCREFLKEINKGR